MNRRQGRPGFIYFAEAQGFGMVKIGHTDQDPHRRIESLQSQCPSRLNILAVITGSRIDERAIQLRLRDCCSHGEWFFMTPAVLEEIGRAQPYAGPAPYFGQRRKAFRKAAPSRQSPAE